MFAIIGLMLTGMAVGYALRRRRMAGLRHVVTVLIWVLLFLLGIEVGGNGQIMGSLHTLGVEAIALALGGTLGSVLAAWWLWKTVCRRKEGGAA